VPELCRCEDWRTESLGVWEQARRIGPAATGNGESWSKAEADNFYRTVLKDAGAIANRSVSKGYEESRRKTWAEFETFVQKVGRGLTIEAARGIDIVAFVHGEWIPEHKKNCRTTVGEAEEKVASAAAIKGVIGHLAKSYAMMGQRDADNPAKEECVTNYREGYRNCLHEQGVREKRAKIMKEGKVRDLVDHLTQLANTAKGLPTVVLLMDRAAVLYLWESWARGKECGELEERQVDRNDEIALPGWSKTIRSEPSGRVELAKGGHEMTFLEGSAELLAEMELQRIGSGRGFLFRPMNKSRTGLLDEPLKSPALKKRVQQHMEKADLFEGETLHSFRRSAVQDAAEI
jgi:integrase